MTETLRNWWEGMDAAAKASRALLALLVLLFGGVVGAGRFYEIPARLDSQDARLSGVERTITEMQEAQAQRDRMQFCRWQAQDEGVNPAICRRLVPGAEQFQLPEPQ